MCQSGASGAPHSRWQPASSSTVSMAAALGSYLAVCSGSTVQMLDLNPQFGQVNIVQTFDFLQQLSAVSLFQTGKGSEEVSLLVQHTPCLLKLSGQCSVVNGKCKFTSFRNLTALHHCPASSSQGDSWMHAGIKIRCPRQVDLQVIARIHHAISSQTGSWKHAGTPCCWVPSGRRSLAGCWAVGVQHGGAAPAVRKWALPDSAPRGQAAPSAAGSLLGWQAAPLYRHVRRRSPLLQHELLSRWVGAASMNRSRQCSRCMLQIPARHMRCVVPAKKEQAGGQLQQVLASG